VCGNLYNNVYVRAGGQDVSSIVNYVPQAQQVKNRLDKSGAWLDTVGKDSFGCDADFQTRVNNTAANAPGVEEETQLVGLGDITHRKTATIEIKFEDGRVRR
jgi:hypothetical protein